MLMKVNTIYFQSIDFEQIQQTLQQNTIITKVINHRSNKMKPTHQKRLQVEKQKDNKSFMLKFKDKHSVISKQGLLKLLDTKARHLQSKTEKAKPTESLPTSVKSQDKLIEKKKIQQIIKARSVRKGSDASITKSVQLPELSHKLTKISKSISTSLHLRKEVSSSPSPKIQTADVIRPIKKVPSSHLSMKQKKKASNYNFQLDQFALDHLDFLDKFQERIRKRDHGSPVPH